MAVKDFLAFRKMITPTIIQFLFWAGVLVLVVLSVGMVVEGADKDSKPLVGLGIAVLVVGPILWRIYCEVMILFFRMNETLSDIRGALVQVQVRPVKHLPDPKAPELEIAVSTPDKAPDRRWMPPEAR
jgi:hypothetical protein